MLSSEPSSQNGISAEGLQGWSLSAPIWFQKRNLTLFQKRNLTLTREGTLDRHMMFEERPRVCELYLFIVLVLEILDLSVKSTISILVTPSITIETNFPR